jgi:hypothetical protein
MPKKKTPTPKISRIDIDFETGDDEIDADNHNGDVMVHLGDGRRLAATVFTRANIAEIMQRSKQTGESLSGLYFYCTDMLIIEKYTRPGIEAAIADIVKELGNAPSADARVGPMLLFESERDAPTDPKSDANVRTASQCQTRRESSKS